VHGRLDVLDAVERAGERNGGIESGRRAGAAPAFF